MLAFVLIAGAFITGVPRETTMVPLPVFADTVNYGFVFVDGVYLEPPYTIIETETDLFVNRERLDCFVPDSIGIGSVLARTLQDEGVLVANSGEPLRRIRLASDTRPILEAIVALTHTHSKLRPTPEFDKLLADFQPAGTLVARATARLDSMRKVRQKTLRTITGRQRSANLAYPMTIMGMLAGIWSLGHLLGSSPRPDENTAAHASSPSMVKATSLSILGVLLLSGLDLIWTLMASHSGQMKELNPLGSSMIDSPTQLVAFKVVATAVGCGVLYRLRTDNRARRAAWWLCLVMTVLTFRWLVFNSMNFSG